MQYVYHVVTDRPMQVGQRIIFDENNRSGVYRRVMEKKELVKELYAHPEKYEADQLEHHTAVACRELVMEHIRTTTFPNYPSRLACLYASLTLEEAEQWAGLFAEWGRPTYHIVKLQVEKSFVADARNCFRPQLVISKDFDAADRYWGNLPNETGEPPIRELLVAGEITVVEIVREINANI